MSMFSTRQFATAFATASEAQARIVDAKRRFFADPAATLRDPPDVVRTEVLQSWKRSLDGGADPDAVSFAPPEPVSRAGALARVVEEQRDAITADLDGTSAWVMVLDRRLRSIGASIGADADIRESGRNGVFPGAVFREDTVGSNGAAIAFERLDAFAVVGAEHFQWRTQSLVTVGAPVRDPVGRVIGVVSMNARLGDAHPVLLPLARGIARTISDALLDVSRRGERVLLAEFTQRASRRSRPVVAVGDDVLVLNGAARQLLVGGTTLDQVAAAATREVAGKVGAGRAGSDRAGEGRAGAGRAAAGQAGEGRALAGRGRGIVHVDVAGTTYDMAVRGATDDGAGVVAHLARPRRAEPVQGLAASIRRAWRTGASVVVRGEPGSGRAHAVREAVGDGELFVIEAPGGAAPGGVAPGGADPENTLEQWFARLREEARVPGRTLLVRDIERLPVADGVRMHAELRALGCRFAATAAVDWPGREPADPIGVVLDRAALRARTGELPDLVESVLRDAGAGEVRVAPEALSVLGKYSWPGNVAELVSALATATARAPGAVIELAHVPSGIVAEASARRTSRIDGVRRAVLLQALREADWNREAAARALGISRATVYRQLKALEIRVPSPRG